MSLWKQLEREYAKAEIEAPALKGITLAQWALESGWGKSDLAKKHNNFGGLKFRQEMAAIATPVDYEAHDGLHTYCAFASLGDFIKGYWIFIDRAPYAGWRKFKDKPAGFLRHIQAAGYAEDPRYVEKVLAIFEQLREQGEAVAPAQQPGRRHRLAIVVGHNESAQGAEFKFVQPGLSEFVFNSEVASHMEAEAERYSIQPKIFFRRPNGSGTSAEIRAVYEEVDAWGADAAIELHFNGFTDPNARGTETLTSGSPLSRRLAVAVQNEMLDALQLPDRRVKTPGPGERGHTSLHAGRAPAILVEPFFGSNREDCIAAAALGEAGLARAYLRGCQAAFAQQES